MKLLLETWRKYSLLHERINSLDPDSGKRFIADTLTEITEEDHRIPISDEELQKIKEWAELEGDPNFLGSGSKGSAYKFGNKVLKITSDHQEAAGALAIMGERHPNVYDIYAVAKRSGKDKQNSEGAHQHHSYVIVYEFLNYPNSVMLEAARHLHDVVRTKEGKIYYLWEPSYLEEARTLLKDLLIAATKDKTILGEPIGKYQLTKDKIEEIADNLGWSREQKKIFKVFYGSGLDGMRSKHINSPEGIQEYLNANLDNPRHDYFHQLALGLSHLFSHGVVFDDLKTSNIMDKSDQAAIIDIGYSRVTNPEVIPELS